MQKEVTMPADLKSSLWQLAWLDNDRFVVIAGDKTFRVFDKTKGECIQTVKIGDGALPDMPLGLAVGAKEGASRP